MQDIFAKAYYTLVHSPIPTIFDTILELEQNYALSIVQLIQARDNEIKYIKERCVMFVCVDCSISGEILIFGQA